jgi:hypothetical protein
MFRGIIFSVQTAVPSNGAVNVSNSDDNSDHDDGHNYEIHVQMMIRIWMKQNRKDPNTEEESNTFRSKKASMSYFKVSSMTNDIEGHQFKDSNRLYITLLALDQIRMPPDISLQASYPLGQSVNLLPPAMGNCSVLG